ncbi:MAG: hypothetical protein J6V44_11940 [Methanobrevibacter sp.]|nr:hypothetical protein [Methanobrevibacter sp.]
MATNFQLKFFKGAVAPSLPSKGSIFFCTEDRTVRVYNGSEWETFAGLVNANLTGEVLEITNSKGEKVSVNLAAYAKVSDMTAALETINNTLKAHATSIEAAQKAADDAQTHSEGVAEDLAQELIDRAAAVKEVADNLAAEAVRADAAEKANAAAAAAADKKAADAQTHSEGVAANLTVEAGAREAADNALSGRLDVVEAAVGTGGSVDSKIETAINALDSTKSGNSAKVTVSVEQEDGKIKSVTVSESDIASDAEFKAEKQSVAAQFEAVDTEISALASFDTEKPGRVTVLEEKVAALQAATSFEGVVEFDPAAEGASVEGYDKGDIVIYGNKEFINDGAKWVELGDTTEEGNRLSALEALTSEHTTKIAQLDTDVKAVAKDLADNYATDAELAALANGAVKANADKLAELEPEIDANTAAVADHKTRIEALEGTAGALGTTYVKVADYNVDKAAAQQKHADLQGEIDAAEGRLDVVEAAIERLDGEQDTQDAAIAAADAKGAQGIADAAAALAKANEKVAAISGDADVAVSGTTEVALSLNKATEVAAGDTKVVTADAVYNAICWAEFE